MTTGNQIARKGVRPGSSVAAAAGSLFGDERSSRFAPLADALQTVLDRVIPLGYEDEAGFHFGVMPEAARID